MESTGIQKKICLLGDMAVGKSSLVRQFVNSVFDEKYLNTIGVTISRKPVQVAESKVIHFVIWDLAGSEDYNGYSLNYLQGAAGAILVCDLTREATLSETPKYQERLKAISSQTQFVIFGNKVDLVGTLHAREQRLAQLARDLNISYLLTSAKTGLNVEYGFHMLARKIMFQVP
jgi:small GTP-binding protein